MSMYEQEHTVQVVDLHPSGYSPVDYWSTRGKIRWMNVIAWTGEYWTVVRCVLDDAADEPYYELSVAPNFMREWPAHWQWARLA